MLYLITVCNWLWTTPSHDPGQSAVPLPSMCTFSLDHEARDDDLVGHALPPRLVGW